MDTLLLSNSPIKVGRILVERYRLDSVLGQGSFGAAFRAEDLKLHRICVVKQMLLPSERSAETLALHFGNFERETSLLVQLNQPGHPNIPEIYDYFSDENGTYLVMKYIEGQSLKELLDPAGTKIPWREAVSYIIDVCSALHYMHSVGDEPVIHRDIKPDNILLGSDKRVWLVDFGLAKARATPGSGNLLATQASGSIGYSPLEQWFGEVVPASDVYAVGATLHHMVTGLHPARNFGEFFDFAKLNSLHEQFLPVRRVDETLPQTLEDVIAAALAIDPNRRPTPLHLKQELEALVSGSQTTTLFTFKNGQIAKSIKELVALCEQNPTEAETYLYNGEFQRWFQLINRNDLAEAAIQAVRLGKNRQHGLKKFLRLILPNLFFIHLGQFFKKLFRVVVTIGFIIVLIAVLLTIGSTYATQTILQYGIANHNWQLDQLTFETEIHISEAIVNAQLPGLKSLEAELKQEVYLDLNPPNQIEITINHMKLPFIVLLSSERGIPHFYLVGFDDDMSAWIGTNISRGINRGIDQAFAKADVSLTTLAITDDGLVFTINKPDNSPAD